MHIAAATPEEDDGPCTSNLRVQLCRRRRTGFAELRGFDGLRGFDDATTAVMAFRPRERDCLAERILVDRCQPDRVPPPRPDAPFSGVKDLGCSWTKRCC